MTSIEGLERQTMRKVGWHIIPLLLLVYFVSSMDRANIAIAALTMNKDIGIDASLYGWGAGIFFLGYVIFEVPSNLIMQKVGARLWIARIMITWGIISGLMAFVVGPKSFLALRFLLGVAEAGYFPGVMLYFTFWLPNRYRARAVGWMFLAYALANSLTPIISGALTEMAGVWGLRGWQWVFVIEALPAILLAIPVLRFLPDKPSQSAWLNGGEKAWLTNTIAAEDAVRQSKATVVKFTRLLSDVRIVGYSLMWLFALVAGYGVTFFMPLMIKSMGNLSSLSIGFLTSVPYIAAIVGLVVFGYTSDRYNERRWHYLISMTLSAVGFIFAGYLHMSYLAVAGMSLAAFGIYAARPAFWAVTVTYLSGPAAAGGLALVNSIGSVGGFVGPYAIGYARTSTGDYQAALYILAGSVLISSLLAYFLIPSRRGDSVGHMSAAAAGSWK
jgi:ACS family tartrate transporter-like MFS transporter